MKCRINIGERRVLSPNYEDSVLFNQILSLTNDFGDALDMYAVTATEEFQTIYGKNEPSLKNLMTFINTYDSSPVTSTDVIELMQSSGFTSSEQLLHALEKSEIEGILIFNRKNLQSSGIFSTFEAENVLERQNELQETLNYLRQNDEIIIQEFEYEETGELLPTGKIKKVIKGDSVVFEGQTSDINVLDPVFNQELSENITFLRNEVQDSTWDQMGNQIIIVLQEIEGQVIENGVDLTGLADMYMNKEKADVIDLLDSVEQALLGEITQKDLNININSFFNRGPIKEQRDLKPSEVLLKTELTEEEVYQQMGLIKVSDNVYRRVVNNLGIVYDSIKEEIADIKNRLNINTFSTTPNSSKLESFSGDYQYLTEDFPTTFGKWLIRNNNKDFVIDERGITFKNLNQKEIALSKLPLDLLEDLEQYSLLSKNLNMPYDVESTDVVDIDEFQMERDKVVANPKLIRPFLGDYTRSKEGIVIKNSEDQFIKVDNQLYEIVEKEGNVSYYKALPESGNIFTIDITKPELAEERIPMQTTATQVEIKKTNNENYKC